MDSMKKFSGGEDTGVSTVIGVVLLTGVVVVSVTTAGAFVVQNFQQQSSVQPLSDFNFEENSSYINDGSGTFHDYPTVTITHQDGESIPTNKLRITVDDMPAYGITGDRTGSGEVQLADPFADLGGGGIFASSEFQSGESIAIYAAVDADDLSPSSPRTGGAALSNPDTFSGEVELAEDDGTVRATGIRLQPGQTVRVIHIPTSSVLATHTVGTEQKSWDCTEDSDTDGVCDKNEGRGDRDNDGTPNYADDDTDGDGIPDDIEGDEDADGDGIPNYKDWDSDSDYVPDEDEYDPDASDADNKNADGEWHFTDYESSPMNAYAEPLAVTHTGGGTVSVDERHKTTFTTEITHAGTEQWVQNNRNPTPYKRVPAHAIAPAKLPTKTLTEANPPTQPNSDPGYQSLRFTDRLSKPDADSPATSTLEYKAPEIGDSAESAQATVEAGSGSATIDITVEVNELSVDVLDKPAPLEETEQGTFEVQVTDEDGDVPQDRFMPDVTASPGPDGEIIGSATKTPGSDGKTTFKYEADDGVFSSKSDPDKQTTVSFSTDGTTTDAMITIINDPNLFVEPVTTDPTIRAGQDGDLTVEVENEYGEVPGQDAEISASTDGSGEFETTTKDIDSNGRATFTYTPSKDIGSEQTHTTTFELTGTYDSDPSDHTDDTAIDVTVTPPKLELSSVTTNPTIRAGQDGDLTVEVRNEYGDVPNQQVAVSASTDGSGSFDTPTKDIDSNGRATFTYTPSKDISSEQTHTTTFTADGYRDDDDSASIDVTVTPPKLVIESAPDKKTVDSGKTVDITVDVANEYGDRPGHGTITASVSGPGSLNTGSQSVTGKDEVTFTYTAPKQGASPTVNFALGDDTASTDITVRKPDLLISSVSPESKTIDPDTSQQITVYVENEYGNTPDQSKKVRASVSGPGSLNTGSRSVAGKDRVTFTYDAPQQGGSATVNFALDGDTADTDITIRDPDLRIDYVDPSSATTDVDGSKQNPDGSVTFNVHLETEFGNEPEPGRIATVSGDIISGAGTLGDYSKTGRSDNTYSFTYYPPDSGTTAEIRFSLGPNLDSETVTITVNDDPGSKGNPFKKNFLSGWTYIGDGSYSATTSNGEVSFLGGEKSGYSPGIQHLYKTTVAEGGDVTIDWSISCTYSPCIGTVEAGGEMISNADSSPKTMSLSKGETIKIGFSMKYLRSQDRSVAKAFDFTLKEG